MNATFTAYQQLLIENPPIIDMMPDGPSYRLPIQPWWEDFLADCRAHALKNTEGRLSGINIVTVHPYFDELPESKEDAKKQWQRERRKEINTLEDLLKSRDRSRMGRVLFDSHFHYALKSHELVDEGHIDKVVFTPSYTGVPLDLDCLKEFKPTKMNFVGGTYGDKCVNLSNSSHSRSNSGRKAN